MAQEHNHIISTIVENKPGVLYTISNLFRRRGFNKVTRLDPENIVTRELALIKVNAINTKARSDIINYADIFRARVVDVSSESLMMEITGTSEKIDAFIGLMKPFGVREVARTGITALSRGAKSIKIDE